MNLNEIFLIGAIVVSIGLGIYNFVKNGQKFELPEITAVIEKVGNDVPVANEVIKSAVFAAEQLKRTGKLPDNNAAFQFAFGYAKRHFPNLDEETIKIQIEAAVLLASQASKLIGND